MKGPTRDTYQRPPLDAESVLMEAGVSWDDDGGAPRAVGRARAALESALCLAQCLDVKNSNPADGLTANQMAP